MEFTFVKPVAATPPSEDGAYWVKEAIFLGNNPSESDSGWHLLDRWELVQVSNGMIVAGLTWHEISPIPFNGKVCVFYVVSDRIPEPR